MTEDMIKLGQRAVACPKWRWMPGMLHGVIVGGELKVCYRISDLSLYLDADRVPDLTDPATVGCLLALAREAWGSSPSLYVRLSDTRRVSDGLLGWEANGWADAEHSPDGRPGAWRGWGYASEAEALVAALEAAP